VTSPPPSAGGPTLQGVEPDGSDPVVSSSAATDPAATDPAGGAERDRDLVALEDAERELADLEEELGGADGVAGG
jgi:hypothetical protein